MNYRTQAMPALALWTNSPNYAAAAATAAEKPDTFSESSDTARSLRLRLRQIGSAKSGEEVVVLSVGRRIASAQRQC